MNLGLRGARVLVTAASQGLGAATARQFSREGAIVVINSRELEKVQSTAGEIVEETGNPVFTFAADLMDDNDVQQLVRNTIETLGGLDILVTNAGGPPAGQFQNFDMTDFRKAGDLTLFSAVHLIQECLPHLKQSNRAAILAIVSMTAKEPSDNLTLSNILRPAVVGLTKSLSFELGSDGIRVNSILPGITDTQRIRDLADARSKREDITLEQALDNMGASIPLGRIGTPEEFANTAVFMCSPAGGFINGVALPVDGGSLHSAL